ncbi:DUF2625 family protein [Limibacter armeniacum]|uniref:DUF2625 family protein n=1 Tax=Limibacter armeniacum TaxID=466084 RepID=UPI002FE61967
MKLLVSIVLLFVSQTVIGQVPYLKPLAELVDHEERGWRKVRDWVHQGRNSVEILYRYQSDADSVLFRTQVPSEYPLGAIIYHTGGLLVEGGWLRILGSGSHRLQRTVSGWNLHKSFEQYGEVPDFLLVADDAIGGFFAVNGGEFGDDIGMVYYLGPDTLEWESLGIGYEDFIWWAFNGDLDEFYSKYKWRNWRNDVRRLRGDEAFHFFPPLWYGGGIDDESRKMPVSVEKLWEFHLAMMTDNTENK